MSDARAMTESYHASVGGRGDTYVALPRLVFARWYGGVCKALNRKLQAPRCVLPVLTYAFHTCLPRYTRPSVLFFLNITDDFLKATVPRRHWKLGLFPAPRKPSSDPTFDIANGLSSCASTSVILQRQYACTKDLSEDRNCSR